MGWVGSLAFQVFWIYVEDTLVLIHLIQCWQIFFYFLIDCWKFWSHLSAWKVIWKTSWLSLNWSEGRIPQTRVDHPPNLPNFLLERVKNARTLGKIRPRVSHTFSRCSTARNVLTSRQRPGRFGPRRCRWTRFLLLLGSYKEWRLRFFSPRNWFRQTVWRFSSFYGLYLHSCARYATHFVQIFITVNASFYPLSHLFWARCRDTAIIL